MQYFGGKSRIAKDLVTFINNNIGQDQPFIDLFCGSCNIVSGISGNRLRIPNDAHKYLIDMWKELLNGWEPPTVITKQEYYDIKSNMDNSTHLSGFVGFGCSFAGKWWGGYAKNTAGRNYARVSSKQLITKIGKLQDTIFTNMDYKKVQVPYNSFIYCDIPYKNSTPYCKNEVGTFNHEDFYAWCRSMVNKGHNVYVSEYKHNVPCDGVIVWEKQSKKDIRNRYNERETTSEVLFTFNKEE